MFRAEGTRTIRLLLRRMPRHLFSVLFFALLVCFGCGCARAQNVLNNIVTDLFVSGETRISEGGGEGVVVDVQFFFSPILIAADGVMVVLVAAEVIKEGRSSVDILAKYITTVGGNWADRVIDDCVDNWDTHLVVRGKREGDHFNAPTYPLAVIKDNRVYLIAASEKRVRDEFGHAHYVDWDLDLVIGEILSGAQGASKRIEWQAPQSLNAILIQQFMNLSLDVHLFGFGGSAFLTKQGKIVFIVKAERDGKTFSVILHLKNADNAMELELSFAPDTANCSHCSFFDWEEKLIMVFSDCPGGSHGVSESVDMGKTWRDADERISRLLDNIEYPGDFTTVTIGSKSVLLFTQAGHTSKNTKKYEVCLWYSDGNRFLNAGPILSDANSVMSTGLLYTNGELFFLYNQWYDHSKNVFLTRLKDEIETMSLVVEIWNKNDAYLSQACNKTAPHGALPDTLCLTPMPTDGLVGFLSDIATDSVWHNKYRYAPALVQQATRVPNGFVFSGTDSGAVWGSDDFYKFKKHGLTVVAMVKIHGIPQEDTPLLTVGKPDGEERFGLWYTRNQRWKVISKNYENARDGWEANKPYKVVLMLHNNSISAYANGMLVADALDCAREDILLGGKTFLIFGFLHVVRCIPETLNNVTVTSVLLYNRVFSYLEAKAMSRTVEQSRNEIPIQVT